MVYKKFKKQKYKFAVFDSKGLTLVEVLLVFSIFIFMTTFGLIVNLDSFRIQNFYYEKKLFLSLLENVRSKSLNNLGSKDQGIFITEDNFILFEGESFDPNSDSNELVSRNNNINFSSEDFQGEIIFKRLSGKPKVSGELLIFDKEKQSVIKIESQGRIFLE